MATYQQTPYYGFPGAVHQNQYSFAPNHNFEPVPSQSPSGLYHMQNLPDLRPAGQVSNFVNNKKAHFYDDKDNLDLMMQRNAGTGAKRITRFPQYQQNYASLNDNRQVQNLSGMHVSQSYPELPSNEAGYSSLIDPRNYNYSTQQTEPYQSLQEDVTTPKFSFNTNQYRDIKAQMQEQYPNSTPARL